MAVSDEELQRWREEAEMGMRDPDPAVKNLNARIYRLTGTAGRLRENNRYLNDVRYAAIACLKDSSDCGRLQELLKGDGPNPD